jgi:magnesium transporter
MRKPVKRHPSDRLPITVDVAIAHDEDTAGAVLERLRRRRPQFADVVYVVDEHRRVIGAVPLFRLVEAPSEQRVVALCEATHTSHDEVDPEVLASLALRHGLTSVPVVDRDHRLLGAVTPHSIMQVLRREHIEDLHRMSGIRREMVHNAEQARRAIEAPPLSRARDRLPWLLVGLAGSAVATMLMRSFEATLQARLAVVFFVPAIVYLADAIGTQTEAIAVRGLSLSHSSMRDLLWGELRTGFLIGTALALLAWPAIWLAFDDARIATTVAVALAAASTMATTIGLLFPWVLARFGKDPALGSGPVATIVQDVLSLAIYLIAAAVLLDA